MVHVPGKPTMWHDARCHIPSALTTIRYYSTIPLLPLFLTGHTFAFTVVATVLALTDWFDGWLSRLWNCTSLLGAEFDISADKNLCAFFLAIGLIRTDHWLGYVPIILLIAYHAVVIEMHYTNNLLFKSSRVAKMKMFIEMPSLIVAFTYANDFGLGWINTVGHLFLWLTAAFAVWSWCHYMEYLPDWPERLYPHTS